MIIQKSLKNNSSIFILIDLVLVVCMLFLIPKLSTLVLPQKQTYSLNQFLKQTEITKAVNPQQFWQFREFYSPGYFQAQSNHIDNSGVSFKDSGISQAKYFTSSKIQSIDALITASSLSATLQVKDIKKIILQTDTILLVQRQHDFVLAFILPQSEMEKANGLFNYQEDTDILNGKNWIDISIIKPY